jgi:TRAP transporter TAXI family solute receptor
VLASTPATAVQARAPPGTSSRRPKAGATRTGLTWPKVASIKPSRTSARERWTPSITSDAILRCGAVLLPVAGAAIDALVEENPYFRSVTIAAGTYPGQDDAVESFGVGATLVTRADVSDDLVADLVSAVLEDFDSFTGIHPALSGLTPSELASAGLSAPLHPGAERAYEKGGLK